MTYIAAILALAWVVAALVSPRWALEAPPSVPLPWLREMGILCAAPVSALVAAALVLDGPERAVVLQCGACAVAVSALVDLWRWSRLGLLFDAALFSALIAAVAMEAGP